MEFIDAGSGHWLQTASKLLKPTQNEGFVHMGGSMKFLGCQLAKQKLAMD